MSEEIRPDFTYSLEMAPKTRRSWRAGVALLFAIALLLNAGCDNDQKTFKDSGGSTKAAPILPLSLLSLSQDNSAKYEERMLADFGKRHHVLVQYIPSGGDSTTNQLGLYQDIFRHHYSQPDIVMIDTEWPALLADDLVDLKPYLPQSIGAFAQVEIQNNTVNGRLVGLPIAIDYSVLYYRPSLLMRYGFHHPPETWDDLEQMAHTIQTGERKRGNREFWGYVWAGGDNEGLTCHSLEWFLSNTGRNFVEPDRTVWFNSPQNVAALKRAAAWIGSISPPGVPIYQESDVENLWRAGQAAFIGGWINMSKAHEPPLRGDSLPFEVAPVPAGPKGHFGVLGDMSLGVSKYAANRDRAIQAIEEFTGDAVQHARLLDFGVIPTRLSLFEDPVTFHCTLLRNPTAQSTLKSIGARPSTVLGADYDRVSREISANLNAVLFGRLTAEAALAGLQDRIEKIVRTRQSLAR